MQALPKITVVTPSFNQGRYLKETLDSVISQGYPNLEYIVIDGGSTDKSVLLLKKYSKHLAYWVSEKDRGQSHAINKGFAKSTGDILCWLNSDDQFAPRALWNAAVAFMTSKADVVAGICEVFEDGELTHRHMTSCQSGEAIPLMEMLDLDNGWNAGQFFYQPEVFFTRDIWQRSGGYVNEDYFYSMDYELWCRLALNKAVIHTVGTPLVKFRHHKEQKTANPANFKKELTTVRDAFCIEHGINFTGSQRPPVNWGKKLKVAMVNNLGFLYGAGIAQKRIAGAFELAGHEIRCFDLLSDTTNPIEEIMQGVNDFKPSIVIFGNLHDNHSDPLRLLSLLSDKYKCYWVTHDFWLVTGRCGYFEGCRKFLVGCDALCPTPNNYPALAPEKIRDAWNNKRALLKGNSNITMLANSMWAGDIFRNATSNQIETIKLGVPSHLYKPLDKRECREKIGIDIHSFVLFFSVSSLSDPRKGGEILVAALEKLNIPNLVLLVVGRLDVPLEISSAKIVSLGYLNNTTKMVQAMNAADVYIGPSTEETLGQVFLEAAMCGLPSVGFNVTGIKDAIEHGVTGIKVDDICEDSLASALQELYDKPQVLSHLTQLCRAFALNEFSLERSYASFFQVLRKQGLIDELGIAHKTSFHSKSQIIEHEFVKPTTLARFGLAIRRASVFVINLLPIETRAKIVRALPDKLTRFLIRLLY